MGLNALPTAFIRDVPEHMHEDVLTMIAETASGWGKHECVTILELDRIDAINVRAHGIIRLNGEEYRFIVEDGNWNGTTLEDWEGDKVFEPLHRAVWALQPTGDLIDSAIISGRGPFLIMKWDAVLKNLPDVAAIPGKYSYDRMMQPGSVVEKHWNAAAAKHHFVLVDKETADETRRTLSASTGPRP